MEHTKLPQSVDDGPSTNDVANKETSDTDDTNFEDSNDFDEYPESLSKECDDADPNQENLQVIIPDNVESSNEAPKDISDTEVATFEDDSDAVSYTHLTLPTILLV